MGYHMQDGRYADVEPVSLGPIEGNTISADAVSEIFEMGDRGVLRMTLDVTAFAPTSLDVTVMTCDTKGGTYYSAGAFTQVTGTGSERKAFTVDRFVYLDFNHAGSGAITLSAEGEAA